MKSIKGLENCFAYRIEYGERETHKCTVLEHNQHDKPHCCGVLKPHTCGFFKTWPEHNRRRADAILRNVRLGWVISDEDRKWIREYKEAMRK